MLVVIKLEVEGIHQWKAAPAEVGYLRDLHRHIFHIEVEKEVDHNDRDVEIIMFKRTAKKWLYEVWEDPKYNLLNFEEMSCEMIAKEIGEMFTASKVKVLEDNENGAVWTASI